jgi:porin
MMLVSLQQRKSPNAATIIRNDRWTQVEVASPPLACRENDRMGIGYFYSGLSSDFKNLVPLLALEDLQRGEIYYNAEIKPWFHLTADLQVVQPGLSRRDAALVLGLRGKVDL